MIEVHLRKMLSTHEFIQQIKLKHKPQCKLPRSLAIFLPLLNADQLYFTLFFTFSTFYCLDLSKYCTIFCSI